MLAVPAARAGAAGAAIRILLARARGGAQAAVCLVVSTELGPWPGREGEASRVARLVARLIARRAAGRAVPKAARTTAIAASRMNK